MLHLNRHAKSKLTRLTLTGTTLALTALLTACGGGSGSASTALAPPSQNAATLTGSFIDGPVNGLLYKALPSGQSGTTDSKGTFSFQSGDAVTFSIPTPQGNITLGSYQPQPPAGGGTTDVSVLGLVNGPFVAQTLQSLSHSGSSSDLDVSGLSLSATDVSNIQNYINYGATGSGLTTVQMFSTAQNDAMASNGTLQFQSPSQITLNSAASAALQSLTSTGSTQSISTSATVPGNVSLVFGTQTFNNVTTPGWYINYYATSGYRYHMYTTGGVQTTYQSAAQPYATSGNQVTITEPSFTLTHTYDVAYPDFGFFTESSTTGETGQYSYTNIQGTVTVANLQGQTIYMSGPPVCFGQGKYNIRFASALNSSNQLPYALYCGATPISGAFAGTGVAVAATFSADGLPDGKMVKLVDAANVPHYFGLVSGAVSNGVYAEFSPISGYSGLETATPN